MTYDSELDPRDVCFVGMGSTAVCYYRCVLPAMALGADWVGVYGKPERLSLATGLVRKGSPNGRPDTRIPDLKDYRVVVLQQPAEEGWVDAIRALQEQGVKVVFEVDDYLHGVPKREDHGFREHFTKDYLARAEKSMKAADALIVSTDYLAAMYRHFNKRVFVCKNGIDARRYDLSRPKRETVNVGWAGATGHRDTILPWLTQVAFLMKMKPKTCFVSIGQPFAEAFKQHFTPERAISVPFAAIEQYPAAMTMFDLALAPSGPGGWWQAKSDLRWLEAGAVGVPLIAHPQNYPEIEDGVTGFHADSPEAAFDRMLMLVEDQKLREHVGEQARRYVKSRRSFPKAGHQWQLALDEIASE